MQNRVAAIIALGTVVIGALIGLIFSGAFSSDDGDTETAGAEESAPSATTTLTHNNRASNHHDHHYDYKHHDHCSAAGAYCQRH